MAAGSNGYRARPGEAPAHAGTDFIIARDGRIAVVYFFSTNSRQSRVELLKIGDGPVPRRASIPWPTAD